MSVGCKPVGKRCYNGFDDVLCGVLSGGAFSWMECPFVYNAMVQLLINNKSAEWNGGRCNLSGSVRKIHEKQFKIVFMRFSMR